LFPAFKMPPKKKGKKKKKKKKDDGELTVEDKYKKTLEEIEALKDHLSTRKEIARRAVSASEEWRAKKQNAYEELESCQQDAKSITADMTRQYKTMQTEMGLKVHELQSELDKTQRNLELTEAELKKTREEKDYLINEKDVEIRNLKLKIDSMEMQYESVLNDALDKLMEKIGEAKLGWENKSTMIQSRNKQTLLEFGLNPLDI